MHNPLEEQEMQQRDASAESNTNKTLVRRYIEEANNEGKIALVDDLMAPDYVWHGGPTTRDELKQFIAWQRASAPDWRISIQDIVAEGDRVAVRATAKGIRTEEAVDIPFPEPRYMELTWIAVYRIEDGRIAEVWVVTQVEMSR
jgi:predicted ester cyclase